MPELPEVETVRRGLERRALHRRFTSVAVTGRRTVRRHPSAELSPALLGRQVEAVRRKGKFLAVLLDGGTCLVIHLRMTGQLLWVDDPTSPRAAHTHVVVGLDDGSELRFVDPRTFGEWYVTDAVDAEGLPSDFARLGPDPIVDGLTAATLAARLGRHKVALKAALTDQTVVAGIGSIYADEICFAARVRPDRRTDTLSRQEIGRLARAAKAILARAIELRGSSLRDEQYRDLMGELGSFQSRHKVYDRAGLPCRRCRASVSKIAFGARVAYCCESCQL
ncbi:MAG: bifunctional DNA-formamidopyrimidine glycosylase/DNA-(apurinic or apyrimidinic site) lyase [Acidimicrobiales bacterium]